MDWMCMSSFKGQLGLEKGDAFRGAFLDLTSGRFGFAFRSSLHRAGISNRRLNQYHSALKLSIKVDQGVGNY